MVKEILVSRKYLLNIILAVAAAGIMVFYSFCTTSCAYLKGDLLGLDLKYVGILFMMIIIALKRHETRPFPPHPSLRRCRSRDFPCHFSG